MKNSFNPSVSQDNAAFEPFTMIDENPLATEAGKTVFEDLQLQSSGKQSNLLISLLASMRAHHPEMTVTFTTTGSVNLLSFAQRGYAKAELDMTEDKIIRGRFFIEPWSEEDSGYLVDCTSFARYKYTWKDFPFILYTLVLGYNTYEFILFPPDDDETTYSNSKAVDALMTAAGNSVPRPEGIYVFDGYWYKSTALLEQVKEISWDNVILDEKTRYALTETVETFFENESRYKDYDVPWKRGIIFYGPPGNGKTYSLKALMHSLSEKKLTRKVSFLYVKRMSDTWDIGRVFSLARQFSPALLIFEDIDSMIRKDARSYFFNEMDGLASNDGLLFIATTNHLDELDPGLKNRPSRFDRKYLFPNPSEAERETYSEQWRQKIKRSKAGKNLKFPEALNAKIAHITKDFSFAYLKEAFTTTLMALARAALFDELNFSPPEPEYDLNRATLLSNDQGYTGTTQPPIYQSAPNTNSEEDKELSELPFWKEFKAQVAILREDLDSAERALLARDSKTTDPHDVAVNDLFSRPLNRRSDRIASSSALPYRPSPPLDIRGGPPGESLFSQDRRGIVRDPGFQIDSVRVPFGPGESGRADWFLQGSTARYADRSDPMLGYGL